MCSHQSAAPVPVWLPAPLYRLGKGFAKRFVFAVRSSEAYRYSAGNRLSVFPLLPQTYNIATGRPVHDLIHTGIRRLIRIHPVLRQSDDILRIAKGGYDPGALLGLGIVVIENFLLAPLQFIVLGTGSRALRHNMDVNPSPEIDLERLLKSQGVKCEDCLTQVL